MPIWLRRDHRHRASSFAAKQRPGTRRMAAEPPSHCLAGSLAPRSRPCGWQADRCCGDRADHRRGALPGHLAPRAPRGPSRVQSARPTAPSGARGQRPRPERGQPRIRKPSTCAPSRAKAANRAQVNDEPSIRDLATGQRNSSLCLAQQRMWLADSLAPRGASNNPGAMAVIGAEG